MTVIPTMLQIFAGIAIFAGLYHIIVAIRGVDRKTHLTFGLSVLAIPVYTMSSVYLHTAQNADTYFQTARIQMFCLAFFFILYCWFIAFYSKITLKPFLIIITITCAAIPFIRLFSPTTMVYNNIEGIRTVLLPWGEQVNTIRAGLSGFGYFYFTFIFIIILYPLLIGLTLIQKKEKRKGIVLVIGQCFLFSTVCIDIFIDTFQLQWFYSSEIGILSLIVLMSYKLSDDLCNTVIMKAKLVESEERFFQIAENMEQLFFLMDKSTHSILYVSPVCEPILGLHPDKLLERQQNFFNLIHPDDRVGMKFLNNERRYTETHNEEFRIIRPDGKIRWLRLKAFPLFDKQQNSFRTAGVISDVTEFKTVQEQSDIQRQQLIQADKLASIGLMVSGVAHEINNSNNLIMMNGGVLKTFWEQIRQFLLNKSIAYAIKEIAGMSIELTCKEFERMLDGILSGSNRIQAIVRDLQNFTRDERASKSHDISIKNVLQTSYSLVRNLIKKSTNNFNLNHGPNIPLLTGNMQKLEQVIINMLTNACQAMTSKEDSITLSSSYNEEKKEISIVIEDTGTGISEDILKKIMDPFFTTKKETGGTGLGLSVSYGIIKDHGGHINVESQIGKGTKFTIILPTGQRKNNVSSYTVSQIIS